MVYIRLFHGRTNPYQNMDDWGADGPVFGPYRFAHITYSWDLKMGRPDDEDCDVLHVHPCDMVYYDGVYYGDWTIFGPEVLEKTEYRPTPFQQEKANLPK